MSCFHGSENKRGFTTQPPASSGYQLPKMMRQISLLAAGCQPWHINIVAYKGHRFAYASTLAVYVYQMDSADREFKLHSIMAEHKRTISALQWHPSKDDWLASASLDPMICVWDVSSRSLVATLDDPHCPPVLLSWRPELPDVLVYLAGKGPLYEWDIGDTGQRMLKDVGAFACGVTQMTWHHDVAGKVAFGHLDGSLSVLQCGGHQQRHIRLLNDSPPEEDDPRPVVVVQWDPSSSSYLLVGLPTGHLFLLDTSPAEVEVVAAYTCPSRATTVKMASWVPGAAGTFLSGDAESGVLRVWNVSKGTPLENIHVHRSGFHSLCATPGFLDQPPPQLEWRTKKPSCDSAYFSANVRAICLFNDGGVGLYNVRKRSWDFLRESAHTETIFDCQFKPDDYSLLATGSYDGTVKIWNVETMTLEVSSPPSRSIIYSISWAPVGQDCIAVGTSRSGVLLWDTAGNAIKRKLLDHGKHNCVYCVAWNQTDARKIASGGSDNTCMVHQVDGSLCQAFKHPGTVFGCDWHPNNENILATACEDSLVRIFYLSFNGGGPLKTLTGHKGKVFRVKWSPLYDGMLCSTSDDNTVHVWNYTSGSVVRVLKGHEDFTRSVLWCPEIPHLLLSGSWDSTIRVWDVRNGSCLDVVSDHGADIYGLTCHPQRPFIVASSSRDSTLRIWTMLPSVSNLYLKILSGWDLGDVVAAQGEFPNGTGKEMLCGAASRNMKHRLSRHDPQHGAAISAWSKFFCGANGVLNLWDLVAVVIGGDTAATSNAYKNGIVHYTHLVKLKSSKAHELELVKMSRFGSGGIGAPSRDEALRLAAGLYLAVGNLQKHCEILVERGLWTEALALAPGVSLRYWQYLAQKRASDLAARDNDEAVQYYLALGDVEGATRFLDDRGRVLDSYTLSVAAAARGRAGTGDHCGSPQVDSPQKTANINGLVREGIRKLSRKYLAGGSPVLAACHHLGVDDIEGCIRYLIQGNELELALSVALVTGDMDGFTSSVLTWLAWRSSAAGQWELAVDLLNLCQGHESSKVEVLASCALPLADRNALFRRAGLKSVEEYTALASQEADRGNEQKAFEYYLLSEEQATAFELGTKILREKLSLPDWSLASVWETLRWTQSIRDKVVLHRQHERLRAELLFFSSYLGALKAIRDGYRAVVAPLLRQARRLLTEQLSAYATVDREQLLDDIKNVSQCWEELTGQPKEGATHEESVVSKRIGSDVPEGGTFGAVAVTGSHLPRHSDQHPSLFTSEAIKGPLYVLDDGVSAVSLSEAIMWSRVNLLSPLGTFHRIVPF